LRVVAVVPARLASTRLPGKPLVELGGLPLVVRVYRMVERSPEVDEVLVAADSQEVFEVASSHGCRCVMTPPDLQSGGDRVAYVARDLEAEVVLNVQVDDPFVAPSTVSALVRALQEAPEVGLALVASPIEDPSELFNPHVVKVVMDLQGFALYFSRSPIPYRRSGDPLYFKHTGPYAYRKEFLLRFASSPPTPLELAESLEMLRVLEMGFKIKMVVSRYEGVEIDTPEDLERARALLSSLGDPLLLP